MPQVVIENPVINAPFSEPTRHFRFTDEGISNEIVDARRVSQYFVPIARPRKKGSKQLQFDTEWTQDRIEENELVIINDEAHHCYRRKLDGEDVKLTGDERLEAKQRDEEARVWNVSKMVFDYIAGWEKPIAEATIVQAGQLPIFRNDDEHGEWLHRPNTILVDSQQLESGDAMSDDFKKIASREIEEFKTEYRVRFPGRDAENLTDEDLLREG